MGETRDSHSMIKLTALRAFRNDRKRTFCSLAKERLLVVYVPHKDHQISLTILKNVPTLPTCTSFTSVFREIRQPIRDELGSKCD